MKILWFTPTLSLYDQGKQRYHGGGWIESLEFLISGREDIDLALSFFHKTDSKKVLKDETTYYPIKIKRKRSNPIQGILDNWKGTISNTNLEDKYLSIINDFQPDVIHVFGSETEYTKVQQITSIPVVIHLQGIINPLFNAFFPVNQSKWNFLLNPNYILSTILGDSPAFIFKKHKNISQKEKEYLSKTKFVMGRTHWDKLIANLYNPTVRYFHVDEVLRPIFYDTKTWDINRDNKKFRIISTLSPTIYKGIDVVLKTAKHLKELTDIDFQWEIIGLDENAKLLKHFERNEKIQHQNVNVICRGRKNAKELIELLQTANVFVHPSYIDNSPNSVCEAQIIGLPVIACNVGGVSSLIEHSVSGILVPSNGVFELVHYLVLLNTDNEFSAKIGQNGKQVAITRHNQKKIVEDILKVYSEIRN